MALEPGQIIDAKYKVIRLIGEGGMGTVYEGENTRIARRVAIKVLHAQVAAMADFVARFEREARAVARIGSQHVCDVLDLGDLPNGDRYIVMEYLDGVSFEDRLERGKLTPAQLAPIAFELLEGLGTMHVAGVIHRDLKPANVFLSRTSGGRGEVVKILDFGVAKLQPLAGEVGSMTQTGTMMGTPLYMSPEQARGARDVDGRTDLYAASVMFYRALTGVLPYNAETLNELLFKIVLEDPRPLRELAPEVDEVFAAIVHKGLARELPMRFQSARAFQDEIVAWGKTLGRSSLSFAATHASDRPPATPITLPEPARMASIANAGSATAGGRVASAVSSAGTPIAWSEAAPGHASSPNLVAPTVLTPISSQPQTSPVAGLGVAPSTSAAAQASAPPSNATLSSSTNENSAIANAQTAPVVPPPGVAAFPATAAPASASAAGRRSPRGLIIGLVAAGAVAIVAIVAVGRTGAEKPSSTGLTATASPSATTPAPLDSSSSPSTTSHASGDLASATDAAPVVIVSADAHAAAAAVGGEPVTARPLSSSPGLARRTEPNPKPPASAAPSTAPLATTAASTGQAPTTAASATPAKPASSARKFRTNLD